MVNTRLRPRIRRSSPGLRRSGGAKELWKTKTPPRVKIFFWLALHRRLWTTERQRRHGLQDHDACILCHQEPETCDHLFTDCVFTKELWFSLLAPAGLVAVAPVDSDLVSWWLNQRVEAVQDRLSTPSSC